MGRGMTTSRDRVIATLNQEPVDVTPRDLWTVPGVENTRGDELAEIQLRYPSDLVKPDFQYPRGQRAKGTPCAVGQYTDAWGCVWRVAEPGLPGEVQTPPLADLSHLADYHPPHELLEGFNVSRINRGCAATPRFVLAWTETRPFERLQFLHGAEATFVDLAHGTAPLRRLLAMLHDFFCREMELWASTDVDGVAFLDDWGSQTALLVSPEMWRDLFKPLYREYCAILHAKDKFAFFHSDGFIEDIFGDLVEVGIDAINSQLFCMNIEGLAQQFRGKVTFWGEIDRQRLLPFARPADVRAGVQRVQRALDFGHGGVIAQCEWGLNVPLANIAAVFEQWQQPVPMHV